MQLSIQILRSGWTELTGWALIASGLSLATWTLGKNRRPKSTPAIANRAQRPLQAAASSPLHRIDPVDEWQRLMQIAERGLGDIESLAASQARACEEIEAADKLLADCAAAFLPYEEMDLRADRNRHLEPAPTPLAQPLAA